MDGPRRRHAALRVAGGDAKHLPPPRPRSRSPTTPRQTPSRRRNARASRRSTTAHRAALVTPPFWGMCCGESAGRPWHCCAIETGSLAQPRGLIGGQRALPYWAHNSTVGRRRPRCRHRERKACRFRANLRLHTRRIRQGFGSFGRACWFRSGAERRLAPARCSNLVAWPWSAAFAILAGFHRKSRQARAARRIQTTIEKPGSGLPRA